MKKFKSMPLYLKILAGMILGVLFGAIVIRFDGGSGFVFDYIKPFGDIFMRTLKLIAVPLIVISLLRGVGNLGNVTSLRGMGVRTLLIYVGTTLIAIFVGLGFGELISPGGIVSSESAAQLQQAYGSVVSAGESGVEQLAAQSPLKPLVDMFPENMFGAMATNGNMLQVIVIAILLGVAMLLVGKKVSEPFMKVLDSLDAIVLKVVDIVMMYAPFGVFALMCSMVADSAGDLMLLGALGMYALTVILALLTLIFVVYPLLIRSFGGVGIGKFFRAMAPVQLLAFTTSSSAATLPLNMETVRQKLGVSDETSSFVLPVGVTINMDGTSCYQIIAALFIAQVMGVSLGWQEIAILVATTTISSIGTPGIPGGSIVVLVMVLSSIGIPAAGLALIMGMDRPLDMLRTVVNVTGDATVATIVDRRQKTEK